MLNYEMVEFLALGIGFVSVLGIPCNAIASYILHYVIALRARPASRAAWTAGASYLCTVALFLFGGPPGWEVPALVGSAPGALIAYWYMRRAFRRMWVNDESELPEGASMANDDWRIGLLGVVLLIALLAVKGFARLL